MVQRASPAAAMTAKAKSGASISINPCAVLPGREFGLARLLFDNCKVGLFPIRPYVPYLF